MSRHLSKNTMFWRADERLKALLRDPRWTRFHRACGESELFFDDIDEIKVGYQAVAFRVSKERGEFYQEFVARGTGGDPIAAVVDAYHRAREAGDPVPAGLESIFNPVPIPVDPLLEMIG